MDSKSKQEANQDGFFGANGGNAVQMGMRTDRLPHYTSRRLLTIDRADLVPRGARDSSLIPINPGCDSAGAHYA
jgi:hypothetical protein